MSETDNHELKNLNQRLAAAQCDMDFYGYSTEEAERAFAAAGLPGDRP